MNEPVQLREPVASANITPDEIRTKYIKHEAAVRSIGTLYILGSVLLFCASIAALFDKEALLIARIGIFTFLVGVGIFQFWVGLAVRKLKSWARIAVGVLSGIGLLGFPLGTVINAYILYLVFCEKGQTVFSPEYKQVIAATPYIKYKTSIVIWILLGILVALIALGLIAALLAK